VSFCKGYEKWGTSSQLRRQQLSRPPPRRTRRAGPGAAPLISCRTREATPVLQLTQKNDYVYKFNRGACNVLDAPQSNLNFGHLPRATFLKWQRAMFLRWRPRMQRYPPPPMEAIAANDRLRPVCRATAHLWPQTLPTSSGRCFLSSSAATP